MSLLSPRALPAVEGAVSAHYAEPVFLRRRGAMALDASGASASQEYRAHLSCKPAFSKAGMMDKHRKTCRGACTSSYSEVPAPGGGQQTRPYRSGNSTPVGRAGAGCWLVYS